MQEFQAWLQTEDNGQRAMWPGELTLSEPFFKTLLEHAVPLDQRAVAMLQNSALALDLYTWLVHRLPRIKKPSGVVLTWSILKDQFGQEYSERRDVKRELVKAMTRTLAAYPDAKVEKVRGGLRLKPSKSPIARKGHVVALPAPAVPAPVAKATPRALVGLARSHAQGGSWLGSAMAAVALSGMDEWKADTCQYRCRVPRMG